MTMVGRDKIIIATVFLVVVNYASSAPLADNGTSHALQLANSYGEGHGCYYNFEHYEEGDRILTNEPCLNCTCHNRMLMCYLRVCPFTKAIGQDCTVEKKPDQCCPIITCPQVPVALLTSSTTSETPPTTAVGRPDNYGCILEGGTFYADGAQVPSDPRKPCELCYCIRNHTACVMQECTLNVEGCKPVYQEGVCCPVRYDCDYDEVSTTPKPLGLVTTPGGSSDCLHNGVVYRDGAMVMKDEKAPCEHCYCMRGDIVCAVQECGTPLEGRDCTPMEPTEGQCCPNYHCANGSETTEVTPSETVSTEGISDIVKGESNLTEKEDSNESDNSSEESQEVIDSKPAISINSDEDLQTQNGHTPDQVTDFIQTTEGLPHSYDETSYEPGTTASIEHVETQKPVVIDNEAPTDSDTQASSHHQETTHHVSNEVTVSQVVNEIPASTTHEELTTEEVPVEAPRIPGEGSCLVEGITYPHNTIVPTENPCQEVCRCFSSIIRCKPRDCPPAPSPDENCMPVTTPGLCCPTYMCDQNTSDIPEVQDHKIDNIPSEDSSHLYQEVPSSQSPVTDQTTEVADISTGPPHDPASNNPTSTDEIPAGNEVPQTSANNELNLPGVEQDTPIRQEETESIPTTEQATESNQITQDETSGSSLPNVVNQLDVALHGGQENVDSDENGKPHHPIGDSSTLRPFIDEVTSEEMITAITSQNNADLSSQTETATLESDNKFGPLNEDVGSGEEPSVVVPTDNQHVSSDHENHNVYGSPEITEDNHVEHTSAIPNVSLEDHTHEDHQTSEGNYVTSEETKAEENFTEGIPVDVNSSENPQEHASTGDSQSLSEDNETEHPHNTPAQVTESHQTSTDAVTIVSDAQGSSTQEPIDNHQTVTSHVIEQEPTETSESSTSKEHNVIQEDVTTSLDSHSSTTENIPQDTVSQETPEHDAQSSTEGDNLHDQESFSEISQTEKLSTSQEVVEVTEEPASPVNVNNHDSMPESTETSTEFAHSSNKETHKEENVKDEELVHSTDKFNDGVVTEKVSENNIVSETTEEHVEVSSENSSPDSTTLSVIKAEEPITGSPVQVEISSPTHDENNEDDISTIIYEEVKVPGMPPIESHMTEGTTTHSHSSTTETSSYPVTQGPEGINVKQPDGSNTTEKQVSNIDDESTTQTAVDPQPSTEESNQKPESSTEHEIQSSQVSTEDKKPEDANSASSILSETIHHVSTTPEIVNEINEEKESLNNVNADNGDPIDEDINQLIQNEVNTVLYPGEKHELLPATGDNQTPSETATESNIDQSSQTPQEGLPESGINSEITPEGPAQPADSSSETPTEVISDIDKSELPSTDTPNAGENQEVETTVSPAISEDGHLQPIETSSSIPSHDESLTNNEQAITVVNENPTSEQPLVNGIEAGENPQNGPTLEGDSQSGEEKPHVDSDQITSSGGEKNEETPQIEEVTEPAISHSEVTLSETTQSSANLNEGSTGSGLIDSVNEGTELNENHQPVTEINGDTPVHPADDETQDNFNKISTENYENLPEEHPTSADKTVASTDSSQDQTLETTSTASSHADDSSESAEVTHVETNVPQIPDSANQLLDPETNEDSGPATDQSIHIQENISSGDVDHQITEKPTHSNGEDYENNVQPDSEENTVSVENGVGSEHTSVEPEHPEVASGQPQDVNGQQPEEHHGAESDNQETQSQNVETVSEHSELDQPVEENEHPEVQPENPLEAPQSPVVGDDKQSTGESVTEQSVEGSSHPGTGTEHSVTEVQQPIEGSEHPEGAVDHPETDQPVKETEHPSETEKPLEGTEQPERGVDHPEYVTQRPVEESEHFETEQPVKELEHSETEQPEEGSDHLKPEQPIEVSEHPTEVVHPETVSEYSPTEQSVDGSEIGTQQPIGGSEHTETEVQQPIEDAEPTETEVKQPVEGAEPTETETQHPVEDADHTETEVQQPVEDAEHTETEVQQPVEDAEHTETEVQQPVEGAEHTETEVQHPVEDTEHTETEVQQPVEGAEHTETEVQQPVEDPEHTETEVQQPVEGAEHTEPEIQQPVEGAEHTEAEAQQPVESTEQSEIEAQQPVEGTDSNETGTPPPVDGVKHTETGTKQPTDDIKHTDTETQQPESGTQQPVEVTEHTETEVQHPEQTETGVQQPVEETGTPVIGTEQPTHTETEHPESGSENPLPDSDQLETGTGHPTTDIQHPTVGNEPEGVPEHEVSDNKEEGSYQEPVTEHHVTEDHKVSEPEQDNTEHVQGEVTSDTQGGETESAVVTEQQETSSVQYESEPSHESTSEHQDITSGSQESSSKHPGDVEQHVTDKEPIVESDTAQHNIENENAATTSTPLAQSSSEVPAEEHPQTKGPQISEKPESTGEQETVSGDPEVHKQEISSTEEYHLSSPISVEQEHIEVSSESSDQGANILQSVVHSTETVSETPTSSLKPMEEDSHMFPTWSQKPFEHHTTPEPHTPEEGPYPSGYDPEYEDEEGVSYGPGTCRYGGKVYLSAQQIPRDDPCDFCFCFRSDIICLQQSCPPPIRGCYQETIKGFCCPRYECHVSMATMLNITTTTTTTTTTLPPHFFAHAYNGAATKAGCQVKGVAYHVGERIPSTSGPCLECRCGANGQMKCDPTVCGPQEALLRQVMDAAVSRRRRR